MQNNDKILVGKIVAPQGIRGEVRIQTFTSTPHDFKSLTIISSKFDSDDFKFVRALPNTNVIIAKINDVNAFVVAPIIFHITFFLSIFYVKLCKKNRDSPIFLVFLLNIKHNLYCYIL